MNNYFSHDSNARNDGKILSVRMKYGAEGYGVYFMLLERLREESDYTSVKDYNMIAFDLRVSAGLIKSIIEDFGLFAFTENGKRFYSESLKKRMGIKDELSRKKSEAGKKGMSIRYSENKEKQEVNNTVITQLQHCYNNKGKERKEKKEKKETIYDGKEKSAMPESEELEEDLKNPEEDSQEKKCESYVETGIFSKKNSGAAFLPREEPLPPPLPPPNPRRGFNENVAECLASPAWMEAVQMSSGIRELDWLQAFEKFRANLVSQGYGTEKTTKDFRSHFANWLRKHHNENENNRTAVSRIPGEAVPTARSGTYRIEHPGRGKSVI